VLLLCSWALAGLYCLGGIGLAQTSVTLPTVHVVAATKTQAQKQTPGRPTSTAVQPTSETPEAVAARQLAAKAKIFDAARSHLYAIIGTTSYKISHKDIQSMPQGTNQPVEKVLLQAPGVSQDSAASGSLHVRNDHANLQFRINGVMMPDGVTGFGSILDTSLVGNISLVTGALPAEFGLRTVGLIDITPRTDVFNNSGGISAYGGSQGTLEPSWKYGGTFGGNCGSTAPTLGVSTANCFPGVQYYFTRRYLQTVEGIENPTASANPIHDFSQQEKGFGYMSAFIDDSTRLSLSMGTAINKFQIPDVPGQPVGQMGNPPVTSAFGITNFDSSQLNENQTEVTNYGVLALQKSINGFDGQLSYFTRYNDLQFTPDPIGDLLLNGIASDITRRSYTNGIQGDGSYRVNSANTLRAGFTVSGEQTNVDNTSLVEPAPAGAAIDAPEFITDDVAKLGWLAGVYAQVEWEINNRFTMNAGLRFDQMWQYVDDNQLSPRISLTYQPSENTTWHAGYARYFTPPVLVEAAPANIALFNGTSGAPPAGQANDPVKPERSHYFDAGVTQNIALGCSSPAAQDCPTLALGADAYYKIATDLIDDGNFGQALVLSAFNYAKAYNEGVEFTAKFSSGDFQAYGNVSVAQQKATDVVSNQYLFDNTTPLADLGGLTEFQYIQTHWIYTDHTQIVTGSAGLSYLWQGTRFSADMFYGGGLRSGDANISTEQPYAQFNAGITHEFTGWNMKPLTLRFDVVNIFDTLYQIRSGTGVGVFAPQYGPRRGFFVGLSQKF
jgi:outer membrane receptor protein involved in Fe transport